MAEEELPAELGPWLEYNGPLRVIEMTAAPDFAQGWRSSGMKIPAMGWFRTVHEKPLLNLHSPDGYFHPPAGRAVHWAGVLEGDVELTMELEHALVLFIEFPENETRAECFITEFGPGAQPHSARVVGFGPPPEGAGWQLRGAPA
jgi:hypothetical protein